MTKQEKSPMSSAKTSGKRSQFAALCYRMKGDKPQFLLITSRGTKRWIIPKGWPIDGASPAQTAQIEAWEEAGVRGPVSDICLGVFSYTKTIGPGRGLPCMAMVYPIKVKSMSAKFPELGQRRRKWFSRKKAAAKVSDREIASIIRDFDPHSL